MRAVESQCGNLAVAHFHGDIVRTSTNEIVRADSAAPPDLAGQPLIHARLRLRQLRDQKRWRLVQQCVRSISW